MLIPPFQGDRQNTQFRVSSLLGKGHIDDLKNTVYEIFRKLENEADAKNRFTEGDASCDELNLTGKL